MLAKLDMKQIAGCLVFFICAGLSFGADETFTLKQVRHKGDVEKFHRVMNAPGVVIILYDSTENLKVKKVQANGDYTIEDDIFKGFQNFAGTITQFRKGDPYDQEFTELGQLKGSPVLPDSQFIAVNELGIHITEYVPSRPVKIGEKWSHVTGLTSIECSLVGHEMVNKIDCLRISMTAKLNKERYPGSIVETVWVRAKDFSLQKLDAMIEGAEYTSDLPMKMNKNHVTIDRL